MAFVKDSYDYDDFSIATNFENLEENCKELRKNEAGTSAPGDPDTGQLWYYNGSSYAGLRTRNYSSAWIKVLCGDASQKMWVYRNNSCEGWRIDTSVTDRVLALKGGSNAYDVNGGTNAGTWTRGSHVHQIYSSGGYSSADSMYNSSGSAVVLTNAAMYESKDNNPNVKQFISLGSITTGNVTALDDAYTKSTTLTNTYRPAAAVGTLQYPDLRT